MNLTKTNGMRTLCDWNAICSRDYLIIFFNRRFCAFCTLQLFLRMIFLTYDEKHFQNLPELELLDLAYNALQTFDFEYFDQVGTLSTLRVNVSHNSIFELTSNQSLSGQLNGRFDFHGMSSFAFNQI